MKQFLHSALLRTAVLGALAAIALPARADTLRCSYNTTDRPYEISTEQDATGNVRSFKFTVTRRDLTETVDIVAETDDDSIVKVKDAIDSPASVRAIVSLGRETARVDGEDKATFYLVAVKPGTATITVSIDGDPATTATVQFTAKVSGVDTSSLILLSPPSIDVAEGVTTNKVTVLLGSPAVGNKTLTLALEGEDANPAAHVTVPSSVTIPNGGKEGSFRVYAWDGDYEFTVTVSDPAGTFSNAVLRGSVNNVNPVLRSPNPDKEPQEVSALSGAPWTFNASASDVSTNDNANLEYHWTGGLVTTNGSATIVVHSEGEQVEVYATDDDGGRSETGVFVVKLLEAGKILFTDACTLPTIVAAGGNGTADFVINPSHKQHPGLDDAWQPWDEETGNDFLTPGSAMVRPVLPTNTPAYPFGWMFPDSTLASTPSDLYIPNPNTGSILIKVPASDSPATIRYFSSNPYRNYWNELTGEKIDAGRYDEALGEWVGGFGDFDQDGLSDQWEAWYLDGGKDQNTHSFDEWQTLAVTTARGLYGSSGTVFAGGSFYNTEDTPDNDRLPTAQYEEIDNVWADDPNVTTNSKAKYKVRAFLYPLGGNYVDYGTHVGDDVEFETANGRVFGSMSSRRDRTSKPFFSNILEFRGLQQTSTDISVDMDHAPNWVSYGYPGILTRENMFTNGVNVRGNCPGTDPTVADTDGDGREDGWEYYFWTTILYENKPQYWRAYDPTLLLYPTLSPGGSADFRATGIPLLRDEGVREILITNGVTVRVDEGGVVRLEDVALEDWDAYQAAHPGLKEGTDYRYATTNASDSPILYDGGLYVRYPDQEFEVELIRSECFYGNPVLDPSTRSEGSVNFLTNRPVASTVYYDVDDPPDAPPHPAVEFTIGDFHVYTRDGYVDAQGRAKLFYTPNDGAYNDSLSDFWNVAWPTKLEPGEIPGAYVDFLTGSFYIPGYDYYPASIQALIGDRNAKAVARYRGMNGLFPKAWLLNRFDPRSEDGGLMPNVADPNFDAILSPLGLSRAGWDPVEDLDGDGLTDLEEYYLGTNPLHWDNDNDGMPDGWEVLFGLDPHDKTDGSGNPDCDRMFAVGPYRHADAFLYHYFNQTYWNGQQSLGFVPGAASASSLVTDLPLTSREEFYMQKWMMGKAGRMLMFLSCIYPAQWLDANGNCIYTTNPRNDDSNEDHIPDGWALYAGYIPVPGVDLIDHVYGPLHDFLPPICPDAQRPDPDGDGLGWSQEYENWMMSGNPDANLVGARESQIANNVYVEEEQDSFHEPSWYTPTATRWTNKLRPTSPWIADTDGDGLSDSAEYTEGDFDWNGDGSGLANFNPTTADTRFDRFPDSWHLMAGLYDTTNAPGADLLGPFGPYGDPDGDGLPNYQEYLAGAVYAWRYDQWYSPDNRDIWQPDRQMSGYQGLRTPDLGTFLQDVRAQDARIAEKYSENPIVIPGRGEARRMNPDWDPDVGPWDEEGNDPGLPFWEDAWPYGKSVHFQPYRASDFFRAAPSPHAVSEVVRTIQTLETRWVNTITNIPKVLLGIDGKGNPIIGDGDPHVASGWDERYSPTLNDLLKVYDDPTIHVSPVANYIQRAWSLLNDRKARCLPDVDPVTGELKDTAFISVDEYYILQAAIGTLEDYSYSYGARPAPWEPAPASKTIQYVDIDLPVVWRFMTPHFVGAAGFPTCMPRNPDTDNDGMDDYWEIYHGLNPLYGGSPSIGGAGSLPDSDRADRHPYGNGSTRDWIMNANPAYVRNLTPTEIGPQPIKREDSAFHTPMTGMPIAEAAHFDYKTRPWLAGDRFADPDQDGLANQEESYNFLLNDVLHHTDPSPYWFTDPSYAESYANFYYAADGELASVYWWWDEALLGTLGDGPTYLFDFEMGEGFDTDNDNISDREELTQGNNSGVTDPQDLDSPRNRKALYFDGRAAARTRNPYYHDKFSLTSFTVEFWVRPEALPAAGRRQTLVQRPVLMPVDDSSGATHWQIRHTFLIQIDELGRIHGRVDNDGRETVSSVSTVSAGRLIPGKWAHVALVMDSVGDRLTLYVNGEYAAGVGAGLKPCTGGLFGFQWLSPTGIEGSWENANLYDYSPAPIVLGAYDRNPWGIVGGPYETFPWGFRKGGSIAGQSQPEFDPDQYFTGWMDEVRIWDRCRSQSEIKNWMTRRVTKADIEEVNRKRLAWELEGWEPDKVGVNLVAATTQSDFPQKLLYHYSFDNLPDTIANGRDTSFADYFGQDAWPYPAGWQSDTVSRYRPTPFWTAPWWYHYADTILPHLVPWWYTATHRSNVYSDYSYVPWIENTVAHMPQTPALDMKGLFPNWDEISWTVASYRYRSALDWENDAMIASDFVPYRRDDVVPAALPASGSADVRLSQIKNTMNPYVMFYRTGLSAADETNPSAFAGKLDLYGRYTGIPVLSDMLPLMDAVADIDVEMWDGRGRGTALEGVDTDGDGLPDWWEIAHGLDPNSASGDDGAYADADGDGLDNWAEYLAHTDPFRYDTDQDGYSDYYSRPDGQSLTYGEMYDDGDGMDNVWEEINGLDPNRYDATDDADNDGWTNWEEYMAGTSPQYSDQQPKPDLNVEFHYSGDKWSVEDGSAAPTFVQSYGEKTAGRNMGGWYDGRYRSYVQELTINPLSDSEADRLTMQNYGLSWKRKIAGEEKTFFPWDGATTYAGATVTNWGEGYVYRFIYKLKNEHIGSARVTFSASGTGWTTVDVKDYDKDSEFGLVYENVAQNALVVIDRSKGVIYAFNGIVTAIEYSIGGRSFPILSKGMSPVGSGTTHDHMVSGWNRFLGWLDVDGNGEWDVGEPMGISTPRPTMVEWDFVETTIPLSDSVWDYPRLSWTAATNAPELGETIYYVDFVWTRGHKTGTETIGGGSVHFEETGDWDGDGLEDWMEEIAGTSPASTNGVPNDYYSLDPATSLLWGELLDDGDGMPSAWELSHGLDPERYDGTGDLDDDGWSNWAEFMAETDPADADSYPEPSLDVTFRYTGKVDGSSVLKVQSYAELLHGRYPGANGTAAVNMAGSGDALYTSSTMLKGTFGMPYYSDGKVVYYIYNAMGVTFDVSDTGAAGVHSATLSFYRDGQLQTYELQEFNDDFGVFVEDAEDHIFFEYATGYMLSRSGEKLTEDDALRGVWYTFEYTPAAKTYPFTVRSMNRVKDGGHTAEGANRFLGFMDLNSNGAWDEGEPMGISPEGATSAGWDSIAAEINLSDSLWDYPRIAWSGDVPAAEEAGHDKVAETVAYYVTFTWDRGASAQGGAATYSSVTGDADGDGLEDWMEELAGTGPEPLSTNGVPNDYFSPGPTGFYWGEIHDDGDGMPTAWEIRYGLDPYRFDAQWDEDDDGWSNWAEFMAGTDPSNPDDYPEPSFDVLFRYTGKVDGISQLKVLPYASAVHGLYPGVAGTKPIATAVVMGGAKDGALTTLDTTVGLWNDNGPITALDTQWGTSFVGSKNISTATLLVYRDGQQVEYAATPFYENDDYGVFVDDAEARIFIEWATGLVMTQFYSDTQDADSLIDESGLIVKLGRSDHFAPSYRLTFTKASESFPMQVSNLARDRSSAGHMVEGPNRFLGLMDLNGNGTWDPGEPMGLSLGGATQVGWESVSAEIPLSDSVWGYPRVSWPAVTAIENPVYYVNFTWVRGGNKGEESEEGASWYSVTGDWDNDGLEDWMEALALEAGGSVSTNSVPGVDPDDYYVVDPSTGLTYGELYDDGDGMPTAWEMRYGLDPYRHDGAVDTDDDGWSNWAEFMAGTDPSAKASYPKPKFSATFYYDGKETDLYSVGVYAYGEKTQGGAWGGSFDGRYTSTKGFGYGRVLGSDGTVTLDQYSDVGASGTFAVTKLDHGLIESASISVYVEKDDGTVEVRSFAMQQINPGMGVFTQDDLGWILIEIESGRVLVYGDYVGKTADIQTTVRSYTFPVTFSNLIRNPFGNHTHMVEGPNRFFGWMDVDGNEIYDQGEPMGLGLHAPTLVGWDSTAVEIPLTDSRWDYPRLSWTMPTNVPGFGDPTFFVNFTWVRGASTRTDVEAGATYYAMTGDWDGDGLEDWMEALAGTNPTNTVPGMTNDYYRLSEGDRGLSYGELYDDDDGMPTAWEMRYGLSPYRYDADGDLDDDGWSNYAEFMAGTDPTSASDYPHPRLSATFYYHGSQTDLTGLGIYTYGEKTQGTTWGGAYDGRYTSTKGFSDGVVLGSDGTVTLDEYSDAGAQGTFAVNKLRHGLIESASIDVYVEGDEGIEVRSFQMNQINPGMGLFTQDDMGWILISIESGQVLTYGDYVGKVADVHTTVKTYTFPVTFTSLIRNPEGNHTHMVEGPNRFLGWMDLDGDDAYDQGEPMGLGLYAPTLVGWDSTTVEVPLTDTLWDYPRVSWNDFVPTNFTPTEYVVRFFAKGKVVSGSITNSLGDLVPYGDEDGDGLDVWMETKARTNVKFRDPDPAAPPTATEGTNDFTGRLQYDWVDSGAVLDPDGRLTFGEWLDDTDGMPAEWELSYGLDPHLFDGDSDLDDDGWSNYAEFLADTDPEDPDDYPEPQFDVTFRYDGEVNGSSTLKIMTYSEKRQGTHLVETVPDTIYMGGLHDGLYTTQAKSFGNFGDLGRGEIDGKDFGTSSFGGEHIGSASLTINFVSDPENGTTAEKVTYQLQPYNDQFGVFIDDGEAFVLLEYQTGIIYSQFNYMVEQRRAEAQADDTTTTVIEQIQKTNYESSPHYQSRYVIEYSSSTTHYPFTIRGIQAASANDGVYSAHDHMVEGYNRFLGWMDLDNDDTWDPGEPMGLSLYDATLVGWDSVVTEIPLTDELFGFPRIAWEAATNLAGVTSYRVYIWRPGSDDEPDEDAGPPTGIVVEAPRTFLHEGDYIEAGIKGLDLGSAPGAVYKYEVIAQNDEDISMQQVIDEGEFRLLSQEVNPNDGTRRGMAPIYPVNGDVLHGPLVELRWKMDWRTEGVFVTVKKDGAAVPGLNNLYVPFPVRHGMVTDDDYYYSYVPQLKDGRTLVSLGAGNYTWEVRENLRLSGYAATTAGSSFRIEAPSDSVRSVASISGNVHYYGRLADANGAFVDGRKVVVLAYRVSDRASSSLNVSGSPVAKVTLARAGAFSVDGLEPGVYGLVGFVDANGNGLPDVGETQGMAFLGGSADPIQLSEWFSPIRIASKDGGAVSVKDAHIVLRDRDLNGDRVPELFSGSLAQYKARNVVTVPSAADMPTNWASTAVFDPKFRAVTSRTTKKTGTYTDAGKDGKSQEIGVKAPRTFLHEGDLAKIGLYGFDLLDANAVEFTWEVVATDGYHAQTNAGGTFSVFAGYEGNVIGSRIGIEPRWPIQNTVVHGSAVRFEWTMDDRNAGVLFSLKNLDTGEQVFKDLVVPFPVRHWDSDVECYYYTAVPQMEDGLRFVELPDGAYEYTIQERPRTTFLEAKRTRTERFQIRNAENTRVTGSIEGNVWYYGRSMDAGDPPTWPTGLHVQAYKVADTATSSASVGGQLVAEEVQGTNGAFRIGGLPAGTYSVFAFVDSNTNGVADVWETQGFGVFGGNASPVVIPATAAPIVVTNGASVTQVNIVLHDRDTDNDLLPDVWEWRQYSSLTAHNGYEGGSDAAPSNSYVRQSWSEGGNILTNWSWKATNVVTRNVEIPETDGLRVRIDGPREFMHEGDLLTPYILRDRSAGARDEDANRIYYLWKRVEGVDGTPVWQPLDKPYYGFYLGGSSNAVVNYTVEAWNGAESGDLAKGSFRVVSALGNDRLPMTPRWPVQMAQVHGSPVRFEWNMDDHNAGVLFSLKNLDTNAQVFDNLVVPFPVRHWDPTVKCYYYTAEPQMEDGLRFVDLPAGRYEYTIVGRPQTDLFDPETEKIVERFELVKGDPTLTTATISGDVRYYGRSMDTNTQAWASDLRIQAYKSSDAAVSSASAGGLLVAETVQNTNGAFRIDGLSAGTYSILAFVDSNGNGIADDWETQGFGVYGGNASPVIVAAAAPPIIVTNGAFVTQVNIVLHDRDTDGDRIPDVWEWKEYGSLTAAWAGNEPNGPYADRNRGLSEGENVLTNWSWKATNVITRLIDIPETAGLRVRIDSPRTFLHEGDLLAPYELKDRTPGAADAPENRAYRLWTLETSGLDGMQAWVPLDKPYYGFELGSYTNIDVSWTVEATDGVDSRTLTGAVFRVTAATDPEYDPARPRYPVQNEKVRTSVVEFEWLMDDRSAGVDFRLWRTSGPSDAQEEDDELVVDMTIALPVRHWDANERCYYWTARPQQEDGLRFLDLPDGAYRYEIRTRPRTSTLVASPRTIRERFQMARGEPSRVTGSIAGAIRYFGRSMDAGTPATWPADLHLQARRVGSGASSSAFVGGEIVSDEIRRAADGASTNGAFRIDGLPAGTYTVFAFVDSNGNGVADAWETQGFGTFGGSASPVTVPGAAPPIIVENGAVVTNVNVVLHDRDTDDDMLPDVWEWSRFGNLASDAYASVLPAGFRQIEYVETTGSQYVDLPAYELGDDTIVELDIEAVSTTGDRKLFGTVGSLCVAELSSKWRFMEDSWLLTSVFVSNAPNIVARSTKSTVSISTNGVEIYSRALSRSNNTLYPIIGGQLNANGTSRSLGAARYRGLRIFEGSTLVRDYVPVLDADGVAGLQDRISGQIFYSATATPLVAGPERASTGDENACWRIYVSSPRSDPDSVADWIWPIDWTQVIRRASATAVKEALRVRVEAPRTFLHEGDLLAPYILRDRSPEAADEPANRLYHIWRGQDVSGVRTWIPQTEPVYGFDLGSHSNIVVSWTVEASDGVRSSEIASGSFPVVSETGEARMPAGSRYPVQNEKVRTSVVEFQWTMDESNAGVVFDVWQVDGPEGTKDDLSAVKVLSDRVVPLPVRHWDAAKRCYYWTGRPQQTDGISFVPFEDGRFFYYEISTRPQTDLVEPERIYGRFQTARGERSPTTASIEGTIRYFGRSMATNAVPPTPTWGDADLHLQAWKVSSSTLSSASAGGVVCHDEIRSTNGAFRVDGLPAGTYAIFAFVDSNGNGVADDWETQGFGVYGGNASPVVVAAAAYPIVVTNGAAVDGINVVLHDRDTDNDLLPDVWEWAFTNSLEAVNGYMPAVSNAYVSSTWSEGTNVLLEWSWKATNVLTRQIDNPVSEALRVRVDGPRTFLHEGDFLTPWVYVNKKKGLVAEGVPGKTGNRDYYMWHKDEKGVWQPMETPYYGFELGSYSNVVVNWSVSSWDGIESTPLDAGTLRVVAAVGETRKPLLARYPTQLTEVHGNTVEFEWEMDDSNAGVVFNLWKLDGPERTPSGPDDKEGMVRTQIITNMVVAFPIHHGKSGTDGNYWSAVPQLEDGLQEGSVWTPDIGKSFIPLLGDGLYEYSITERPQTSIPGLQATQTVTERFQLVNSGETRGLYDVSGSIRYYGKVMEVDEDAFAGVSFDPNADRTVWTATVDPATNLVRGAMSVLVKRGDDTVEAFNDSKANGVLFASSGTNSTAWSGTIDYASGEVQVRFSRGLAADQTVRLAKKSFPAPLYLQAYKLADDAETCVSVSGTPVYRERRKAKGDFTIPNLERGKYAILAFIDSNGNGFADDWETQGRAVMTGTVSPNIDPDAAPIVVHDNVAGLMIVLHDRDTDNDLLPDSWEWWKRGNLLTSGYDVSEAGGLLWFQEYADGILDSDPRTPDTDLDGLTDAMEILVTKTDTHLRDTDGDGIGDLEEFLSGSDPLRADSAAPYTIPALGFKEDGTPFVDIDYPALRPGVVLTYELQRKVSLASDVWETVAEHEVANDGGAVYYSQYDGVNAHLSDPGTATMWPADQAEGVDFSTGFFRVKVYADYGKMVDNGDGTWSYWTWVQTGTNTFDYREAARGKGTLVRDSNGNWSFVSDATGRKGVLVRGEDGTWTFQD